MSQSAPPFLVRAANTGLKGCSWCEGNEGTDSSEMNTGLFHPSTRLHSGLLKEDRKNVFGISVTGKAVKLQTL